MTNKLQYNNDPKSADLFLKSKEMDLETGLLGNLFGSPNRSPLVIAGILLSLLIIFGIAISFFPSSMDAKEYWSSIIPVISLTFGYIFGHNSSTTQRAKKPRTRNNLDQ